MTKALPLWEKKKGFWGKAWSATKAVFATPVWQTERMSETQRINTERMIDLHERLEENRQRFQVATLQFQEQQRKENLASQSEQNDLTRQHQDRLTQLTIASNQKIEESRQEFQKKVLALQEFQRKENQFFQAEQNEKNRELQICLSEMIRQQTAYEGKQNRELQKYLAELNRESIGYEGKMNRQLQRQLAELNRDFQANEGKLSREHTAKLELFRAELQKWCLEHQRELQLQLRTLDAELARELRAFDRQTSLILIREAERLKRLPIHLFAEDFLDSDHYQPLIPLKIFLSPPDFSNPTGNPTHISRIFPKLEQSLSKESLAQYPRALSEKYSANGRLVDFIAGAWKNKASVNITNEGAAKAVFTELKTEPVMILESAVNGFNFDLHFAFWGVNWKKPRYKTAVSLSCLELLYDIAKQRTLQEKGKWEGKNPKELEALYGEKIFKGYLENLKIIEREEQAAENGIDPAKIERLYNIHQEDYDELSEFLGICHCLFAGLLADEYFLVHVPPQVRQRPLLPEMLPVLLKDIPEDMFKEFVEIAVSFYETLCESIGKEESGWIPELKLDLALSLVYLPDKSWAKKQVMDSMRYWLKLRMLEPLTDDDSIDNLLGAMKPALRMADQEYLKKLNICFALIYK